MSSPKLKAIIASVCCVALVASGCTSKPEPPPTSTLTVAPETTATLKFANASVDVEVASDDPSRQIGLMYRPSLPDRQGMLFLFPDAKVRAFYMKNTLIPLSIAYMRRTSEGFEILEIVDMTPCKKDPCPTYPSSTPEVSAALEVNKGWFVGRGISAGDTATVTGDLPEPS